MKKYILILNAINVMAKLLKDKRVEGVLYLDQDTGKLTFKLKESPQRYKFYNSVKKDLGRRMVDVVMHRELNAAMQVLEVEEILDRV